MFYKGMGMAYLNRVLLNLVTTFILSSCNSGAFSHQFHVRVQSSSLDSFFFQRALDLVIEVTRLFSPTRNDS